MPAYQGQSDALCGQYAVTNALELCGLGKHREALFRTACKAAPAHRWPLVMLDGTCFSDLRRMVGYCLRSPANKLGIRARYPFYHREPPTNSAFWETFDEAFANDAAVCGIVGLTVPSPHWVVIQPDGARIAFYDSDASNPYYRKNRSTLRAGVRRAKPTEWLIDRRELVIFSVS